jgi:hypothetical protein
MTPDTSLALEETVMTLRILCRSLLILCLACSGAFPATGWTESGKRFFRWVDKEGNVHYTESLPPEQTGLGSKKINQKAMTVETLAGAKTAEQREQESRLKRLRAELIRVVGVQAEHDDVLRRTFRSVDDVQLTLQGKLTMVDGLMRVAQSNRERQTAQLDALQKRAADLERNGKPVSEKLKEEIETTRKLIADNAQKIRQHEEQKQHFQADAQTDAARLQALLEAQGRNSLTALVLRLKETSQPPGNPTDLLVAAVPCQDDASCAVAWKKARIFLERHAPHLHTATDSVLFSAYPAPNRLGLLAGRLQDGKDSVLFLEVLCDISTAAQGVCASPEAQGLREGFRMTLLPDALAP